MHVNSTERLNEVLNLIKISAERDGKFEVEIEIVEKEEDAWYIKVHFIKSNITDNITMLYSEDYVSDWDESEDEIILDIMECFTEMGEATLDYVRLEETESD